MLHYWTNLSLNTGKLSSPKVPMFPLVLTWKSYHWVRKVGMKPTLWDVHFKLCTRDKCLTIEMVVPLSIILEASRHPDIEE
ncbi:hypothetical protein CEXT_42131 [Caerostris extrusa]|uniref:Uncharacterized protein n=1 Tax=Caerostris extrusa TaxID=172846 RepID=A0AAV4SPV3_CAEEX|nr:hypothetical protein CEXT_42131 [Caerostris extrusa]